MRLVFLLSLICFSVFLFGQNIVKGKVIDANSGEPVPYTNIYLNNSLTGTTAFRDGHFQLSLDSMYSDTLTFSCLGYKKAKVYLPYVAGKKHLVVRLAEDKQQLEEVAVKPREMDVLTSGIEPWKFPLLSLKTCQGSFGGHSLARHIVNDHQLEGYVKSVSVFICDEGIYEAPFRVNLLKVDPISGKPREALIDQDYILQAEKGGGWVRLDLEKELIRFPAKGFFVVVQALPMDSAQLQTYKERLPELSEFEVRNSAPAFGFRSEKCDKAALRYWHIYGDSAFKAYNRPEVELAIHCQTIRIKADISYYADQKLKIKDLKSKRKLRKAVDVPKNDVIKYPQSSPLELVRSLQKASETGDLAYLFTYLIHYESKEDLEHTVAGLEELEAIKNSPEWKRRKEQSLEFLQNLESSISELKKSGQRFRYHVKMNDQLFYFHYKNGFWKLDLELELIGEQM